MQKKQRGHPSPNPTRLTTTAKRNINSNNSSSSSSRNGSCSRSNAPAMSSVNRAAAEAEARAPGQVQERLAVWCPDANTCLPGTCADKTNDDPNPALLVTRRIPAPSSSRILSDVEWLLDKFNLDLFLWLRGWAVVQLPNSPR